MTWIKTSDKLPEDGERVLIYTHCNIFEAGFNQETNVFDAGLGDFELREVTHWQYLPRAPK